MMETPLLERRPLATREISAVKRFADRLARTSLTANQISIGGLVAGVLAGAFLVATAQIPTATSLWWLLAAVCVQLRLAANMFDGMVALRKGTRSATGELFNEVPDRVTDAATLIGCGYAAGASPVLGYCAACMAIFVAYVRAIGKVAGADQEFCGPMAKQHRMFFVTMTALWCGLTPVGWQSVGCLTVQNLALLVILIGGALTAIRRLRRICGKLSSW
jgi:phosphatidylglycerophosphate synthase